MDFKLGHYPKDDELDDWPTCPNCGSNLAEEDAPDDGTDPNEHLCAACKSPDPDLVPAPTGLTFDASETATILYALRDLQNEIHDTDDVLAEMKDSDYFLFADYALPTEDSIDTLCEKINFALCPAAGLPHQSKYDRECSTPTPADTGTARALIAHMEQPIPCRHCGKPLHIHSLGWKHSENGYLTCNVSGMVRIAEPKPDTLTCEDYDPDVEAERKWIAGLDGAHPQMGEDYDTGESIVIELTPRGVVGLMELAAVDSLDESEPGVKLLNLPSFDRYTADHRLLTAQIAGEVEA